MKISNSGFTLIEIIVGINMGFILLTVLITFFLFSTKFISTTTKNLDNRQTVTDFLYRLNSKLLKSHSFYFQQLDSSYSFVLDGVDTILLKENSFAINSLYKLEGIEKFKLDLKLKGLENLVITNDKQERTHNDKKKIISELIDKIELKIMISKLQYNLTFTKPDISINKFRNIEY